MHPRSTGGRFAGEPRDEIVLRLPEPLIVQIVHGNIEVHSVMHLLRDAKIDYIEPGCERRTRSRVTPDPNVLVENVVANVPVAQRCIEPSPVRQSYPGVPDCMGCAIHVISGHTSR